LVAILQLRDLLYQGVSKADPVLILRIVNFAFAVALAFANISLPRRPDVFFRDEKVDAQFTVSILSRYTWSYAYPLIKKATAKGDLDLKDVPQPDHFLQVDYLLKAWHDAKFVSTLARSLFKAYRARLFLQWGVICIRCIVGIGPFYIMLQLIDSLQYKEAGKGPTPEMWGYVFWMGAFTLSEMVRQSPPLGPNDSSCGRSLIVPSSGWKVGSLSNPSQWSRYPCERSYQHLCSRSH
jgi:hypothetical protein